MSLLDAAMEAFVMMDRTTVPDGYGGYYSTWTDGAEFQAAATYDTSIQARVAAVQGVKSVYTVTTNKSVELDYHDVIKRKSDDKILRVTSDSKDKQTPPTAMLNMRQVTAEEWSLPNG